MEIDTNGFAIGDNVRDTMTGLVGKLSAFTQYATGCVRAAVQGPVDKDGKVPDAYWTDVLSIELMVAGPAHDLDATRGGPPPGYSR
jgi:hypothetical protein